MLRALLQLDPTAASDPKLRKKVGETAAAMAKAKPDCMPLTLDIARRFQLTELAPLIRQQVAVAKEPAALAAALRTLNEIKAADAALSSGFLDHTDAAVSREALTGFVTAGGIDAVAEIETRWKSMPGVLRQIALDGMVSKPKTAEAFARRIAAGEFHPIDPSVVERLSASLGPDHSAFLAVLESVKGFTAPAIRLPGLPGAVVATGIDLHGPFTIETWIKLDPGIDNRDAIAGSRAKGLDMNFWGSKLRFYAGIDLVIADRQILADVWTHCAVTRDDSGRVTLFLDGEPAGTSATDFDGPVKSLDLGKAHADGGTATRFMEWRVWDHSRAPAEIREQYRTSLPAETPGLMKLIKGSESGYYHHDISLGDGSLISGFLASEDADRIVIRQIGTDDRAILKSEIKEHTISKRSLMPEGLLDGFSAQQVSDLMTYLMRGNEMSGCALGIGCA